MRLHSDNIGCGIDGLVERRRFIPRSRVIVAAAIPVFVAMAALFFGASVRHRSIDELFATVTQQAASAPTRPTPGEKNLNNQIFARRILSPRIGPLTLANQSSLPSILQRLRPDRCPHASMLLHAMHLFGAHCRVSNGAGLNARALDLFVDLRRATQFFGGDVLLAQTQTGLRFPVLVRQALSQPQSTSEAHPGQGLATLACLGVPLDTPIVADEGGRFAVSDILHDLTANFVLDGEIYWDAVALTLYVPPQRRWENKFGDVFTFDDLSRELLARKPNDSSCGGTHRLISLTILAAADQEIDLLSPGMRSRLLSELRAVVQQLTVNQLPDGGWGQTWWRSAPRRTGIKGAPTDTEIIQVTGHQLEWLMMLPAALQPDIPVVERAADHSLRLLRQRIDDPTWLSENYCPAVHAARSVAHLTATTPSVGSAPP